MDEIVGKDDDDSRRKRVRRLWISTQRWGETIYIDAEKFKEAFGFHYFSTRWRGMRSIERREMPITMMEEERVLDFGFDNFLRFIIPLSMRWKDDDNFEAERGEGKFRHSAFDELSDAYYKGDARFDVQHMKRRHPEWQGLSPRQGRDDEAIDIHPQMAQHGAKLCCWC